jgi:hypothetical protein
MNSANWIIANKTQLLLKILDEFGPEAHLSFEGDFSGLRILDLPGISREETQVLKRNTIEPRQDFAVVPLQNLSTEQLLSAIGGNMPRKILHVQVERNGRIEFAAYDSFNPECIVFGPGFTREFLDSLIAGRLITRTS